MAFHVSSKGRYALKLMTDLALYESESGMVSLKEIASRLGISRKYLEQIVSLLSKADFLQTARGSSGGCRLRRRPGEYTAAEILRLTEGNLSFAEDVLQESDFTNIELYRKMDEALSDCLEQITLEDLVQKERERISWDFSI